jgi:hypothetical protein
MLFGGVVKLRPLRFSTHDSGYSLLALAVVLYWTEYEEFGERR